MYVVSYFRIKNNTTTLTSSIGILFSYSFTLGTIIFPVYSVVSGISMQFGLMAAKKFGVFFSYKLRTKDKMHKLHQSKQESYSFMKINVRFNFMQGIYI